MARTARITCFIAAVLVLGAVCFAQHGPTPRPAERPPEFGCRLLDLGTFPNVVRDGDRIDTFLLRYSCQTKTRPVDIEIRNERGPGSEPELVKVATDVVLDKGEHTLRLVGGGLAQGGRYITALKSGVSAGKKEIMRRVDPAFCRGWELTYVEKHLHAGGCDIYLHTDPGVFKTGERIDAFILSTNCESAHKKKDIKISWEPASGGQQQLVKVATDVVIPAGKNTAKLMGGGVGREGHYLLRIEDMTSGSVFKTSCTAWTLNKN